MKEGELICNEAALRYILAVVRERIAALYDFRAGPSGDYGDGHNDAKSKALQIIGELIKNPNV